MHPSAKKKLLANETSSWKKQISGQEIFFSSQTDYVFWIDMQSKNSTMQRKPEEAGYIQIPIFPLLVPSKYIGGGGLIS